MLKNKIKTLWAEKKPVLNGWLSIGNPFTAEIMASQGYDSVTIDIQHGALDYSSVLPMFQAMSHTGVVPMARVPWLDPGIIMKALDAGAMGIICPMINNADEAAKFVSCMRYPPLGQRSYGPTRANVAYGGYPTAMNDEVLAFAMIETADGMKNLDEIAATPGLDGIYIGPADLTLGTQEGRLAPGFDREEPEMIQLIQQIIAACKKYGIRVALHCGTPEYAAKAISWGVDLTTVSGDSRLLAAAASASVNSWRSKVSSEVSAELDVKGGY